MAASLPRPTAGQARLRIVFDVPDWDDVIAIGKAFPEVEEGTSYGRPSLKVRGKHMCSMRTDPDALVIRVSDMGEREALLQRELDAR